MGNGQSLAQFQQSHVRIYKNLLGIQSPKTRAEMIRTLLAGAEYVAAAKQSGVYAHLLAYMARVEAGQRPAALPGEIAMTAVTPGASAQRVQAQVAPQQLVTYDPGSVRPQVQQRPAAQIVKGRRNEKALTYFQNCLLILGLEEEVALTEEALKKAYKRAAVKAHPDKGGTEEEFEAITRAHAYLGEILRRIKGGRTKESVVEAPETLRDNRKEESKSWEMAQPVRLNPKKLDMKAFNEMFEQTRIPDPEEDGYGDWLKGNDGETGAGAQKFGGKFNRDVFNRAFEEEARSRAADSSALAVRQPEALIMSPGFGTEIGRTGGGGYTAPINGTVKYTDLKSAFTTENMITPQVANVRVDPRSFDQYSASRKKAPEPLRDEEMAAIQAAEAATARREEARRLRAAQEDSTANQFFDRMKRLVITNAPHN
jgi:curved DNA-binding protein CbpA